MNKHLLRMNFKMNKGVWIIFLAVMTMYYTMIIGIYDPNNADVFAGMLDMFPRELMDALHFSLTDYSLVGFISGYLFGFIMIIFPMIYIIIVGNRLVASFVDSGSMSYLLASPNTRKKIAITQAVYLFLSTTLLIIVVDMIGFILASTLFPGLLELKKFIYINLGLIGYSFLITSITFAASAIFNETKYSLSFGAGIPIAFFIINMLAGASDKLSFFRYATALSMYNANDWLEGSTLIWIYFSIFILSGFCLYLIGIRIFMKKDLPL
ncbi:MAG: ABC transporter permease subunit [Candidatus Izemoplasmatales bacterium]